MVSARALSDPMPVRDVYSQLLATEQCMNARRAELGADVHMANINFRARGAAFLLPPSQPFYNQPTPPPFSSQQRGDSSRGGGGTSAGGGGSSGGGGGGGNRPTCQICSKVGHVASCCFKRYDPAYLGAGNDDHYKDMQLAAFTNRSANAAAANTHANNYGVTPSYLVDPAWYVDTAATDHFTNNLAKLSIQEPYQGKDQVQTANGAGMRIKHIDHSIIPSSPHPLHLKNILHVPSITRNLLSVKKFTRDNNVFFEFHPWYFSC
jgi:histone deacetylase 1/2